MSASRNKRFEFFDAPPGWLNGPLGVRPKRRTRTVTLRELRDARFGRGVVCPRCRSHEVQRWGYASGRQRYRCGGCGRTFSDFTGTALAYVKLPELWSEFGRCMLESLTVRAAARRLGINKDTAWWWRHRMLWGYASRGTPRLSGIVEATEMRLRYSSKGELREPTWRSARSIRQEQRRRPVAVLIAQDRSGTTIAAMQPYGSDPVLLDARRQSARALDLVVGAEGVFGAAARLSRMMRIRYRRVKASARAGESGSLFHVENVHAYAWDLRWWLRRFHGVATYYLPRYLLWHALLWRSREPAVQLALGSVRPPARRPGRPATRGKSNPNTSVGQRTTAGEDTTTASTPAPAPER